MTEDEIKLCIEEGLKLNSETPFVEFKDARGGFPKIPVRKTLSSFGNTSGGIIVFGIHEDKQSRILTPVGVGDVAGLQEQMTQISADEMNTVLRLDYHVLKMNSASILAVYVPECRNNEKPYHIKELGIHKGAFLRDANTDRQMTENEVRSYIRNAAGDDYDSDCITELAINDLSEQKIREFLNKSAAKARREVKDSDGYNEVLQNIGIIKMCEGTLHPTIAGHLIFASQRPQNILRFERYVIRCVRYKGSGVQSDIIDSADIDGTLDEQIDGMQSFILRNIRKSAEIIGTKRVDRYEYPEKAIREIVANAVIHRDYRITETYTQINIFEDRIEVFNPGNLPPGVTIENIRDAQMSRNKIIAARLKDLDYLEEYGRGIDIVFTEMSKWGLLSPLFKNTANSFRVILPGEKLSKLNDRQIRIWTNLVERGSITRQDAENLLGDVPEKTVAYDMRQMLDIGLIRKIGESRNTSYEPSF